MASQHPGTPWTKASSLGVARFCYLEVFFTGIRQGPLLSQWSAKGKKKQVSVMSLAQRWKHPWATILIQDGSRQHQVCGLGKKYCLAMWPLCKVGEQGRPLEYFMPTCG